MNQKQARRLLIAARDNAVVAAWAYVLDEHKAAAPTDISPYEAWDALQGLCDAGAVTTQEFDALQGVFFDHLPPKDKLEAALINLRILPDVDALEEITGSMFKKSKELQVTEPSQVELTKPARTPLSKPMVRTPIGRAPTTPPPRVPGQSKPSLSFGKPLEGSALPCVAGTDEPVQLKDTLPCIRRGCGGEVRIIPLGATGIAEAEIASLAERGDVQMNSSFVGKEACSICGVVEQSLVASVRR